MDLVTFTEETLNGKLHFSYSENIAQGKIISCRVKNEENIKGKFLGFIFEGGGEPPGTIGKLIKMIFFLCN